MPLSSQFSITLELAKLVPLELVGQATQKALLTLARRLRNSGSDIIVEQDLVQVFGRSRIASQMDSTFRSVVSKSNETLLTNDIRILSGPGPTIVRSFQERSYFATMVQISLLTWVHEAHTLAQCLVDELDARHQHAPEQYLSPPDPNGVVETLSACAEQTAAFNWRNLLQAIAATLELPRSSAEHAIEDTVFSALLDMLPLVQTLPEDRLIHITGCRGICAVVAWSHHVLGLTINVKTAAGKNTSFGTGREQVIFEENEFALPEVALYDCAGESNEIIFLKTTEKELDTLGSTWTLPLRGYGRELILENVRGHSTAEALLQDLTSATVAMALLIYRSLNSGNGRFDPSQPSNAAEWLILEAASVCFNTKIEKRRLSPYLDAYRLKKLDENLEPPPSFSTATSGAKPRMPEWMLIVEEIRTIAIVIICLSHVDPLPEAEELRIKQTWTSHQGHPFFKSVRDWDGKSDIRIVEGTIFECMIWLMQGKTSPEEHFYTSLFTERGWTVYLTAFCADDPASLSAERIKIVRGVPYRNEIRIGRLVDSQFRSAVGKSYCIANSGRLLTLEGSNVKVQRSRTMFSQLRENKTGSSVRFSIRLKSYPEDEWIWVGYRELHRWLWNAKLSFSCSHSENPPLELPLDFASYVGLRTLEIDNKRPRVAVCVTDGGIDARWASLLSWNEGTIILRRENCCLQCVVTQATGLPGVLTVIL